MTGTDTAQAVPTVPTPPPITVAKNGVSFSLVFTKESKGPNAQFATPYYGINTVGPVDAKGEPTEVLPPLSDLVALIGEQVAVKKLFIVAKKGLKEVYEQTLELANGVFDQAVFLAEFANYSFQAVSMKALKDAKENLLDQYVAGQLPKDPNKPYDATTNPVFSTDDIACTMEFKRRIKVITAAIERRSREVKEEVAEETGE